jgi:hypothetical protein
MRWSPDLKNNLLAHRLAAVRLRKERNRALIGRRAAGALTALLKVATQKGRFAPNSGSMPAALPPGTLTRIKANRAGPGRPYEASMVSGFRLASRASNLFSALT